MRERFVDFEFMAGESNFQQSYAAARTGSGVDLCGCLHDCESWLPKTTPDPRRHEKSPLRSAVHSELTTGVGPWKYRAFNREAMPSDPAIPWTYWLYHTQVST
jgi:hypothetical protein